MKKPWLIPLLLLKASLAFSGPQDIRPTGTDLIPERVLDFSCGMEDHLSTLLTPCAKSIINFQLNNRGLLTLRNGYTVNFRPNKSPVTGASYHTAQTGTSFLGVIVGTGVYRTTNSFPGTFTDVTGAVSLTAGITNLAQGASLNDYKVFCNELDQPFKLASSGNASVLSGSPPTIAKTCAQFNNYLFLANTKESGTTYPSRLRWSDINTVDSWPANNYIDVEPNDGDSIICVVAAWRQLLVFKKRSIYQVQITGDSGAFAFVVRPIARNIGCWAKNSVKAISDHGVFFQGPDGVYQLSGFNYFGLPTINYVSDPIYNEFLKINHANFSQSIGGVFRKYNQYWLAITTGTDSTPTEILVFDYIQGSEKNGYRAWTTYAGIAPNMLASAEDNNSNEILLSGDTTGYVYKQDVGNSDNPSNTAASIPFSYTSQDIPLASPELNKSLKYIYSFTTTDSSTMTLNVNFGYDFNTFYSVMLSFNVGTSGALWGTAIWGTDIWPSGGYQSKRFDVNRDHIKTYRIQYAGNNSKNTKLTILGYSLIFKPEGWAE